MIDFQTLRKTRNNDFGKITAEFQKISNPETKSYQDTRFWKLEADKVGNGSATIRFLPRTIKVVDGREVTDELPWVKIWNHGFQGPTGKWYIENSLTTLGENDPVSELNSRLWNTTNDDNSPERRQARAQKRKLTYISNILVISDPKHPENEGKVFLFKYGKKIFNMIMDKARPTFEDEQPINVFDLWEGADFKLRMRKVEGYPNYDQSTFLEPSELGKGDENRLLEIVNSQYLLSEFMERKNFKTYEELSRKLDSVLNPIGSSTMTASQLSEDEDSSEAVSQKLIKPVETKKAVKLARPDDDDDEETVSFFKKIAMEE